MFRTELNVTLQPNEKHETFEYMEVLLKSQNGCIRIAVIYRPPSGSPQQFLDEFAEYIDAHATTTGQLLLLGDFNFHYESSSDPTAAKLRDLLFSMDLQQSVSEPTHDRGHLLDLVITRRNELSVCNLSVYPSSLSDH